MVGLSPATGMHRDVFIGKARAGIRKEGERESTQPGSCVAVVLHAHNWYSSQNLKLHTVGTWECLYYTSGKIQNLALDCC